MQRSLFGEDPDRGAIFSPCRTWRYQIWNCWDRKLSLLGYIGCNPSVADESTWDLTAQKFDGFAKRNGFGGWYAANLFGLVSTDPEGLAGVEDPVGPGNDEAIKDVCEKMNRVVICWGAPGGVFHDRVAHVLGVVGELPLWCFGKTKDGYPRHPSRIPYSTKIVLWKEK